MDYKEKIPLILKRLRLVNKKTQPDIARAVNIDLRTYQRYEHGERLVTTDVVIALALYYGVSTDVTLGLQDIPDDAQRLPVG